MKLLFDQNLSHQLTKLLANQYPNSIHVRMLGMAAATDADIWLYAKQHDYCIVSKDSDFEQRSLLYGSPPKVVWLRIGNCSTADISQLLTSRFAELQQFLLDPTATLLALASS